MGETQHMMRIAVFGTSRSGKDHTIKGCIRLLEDAGVTFIHLSFIGMVHGRLNGRKLKTMDEIDKQELIDDVRRDVERTSWGSNIIVDEHYSFPCTYGGKVLSNGYTDEKLPFEACRDEELGRTYEVVSGKDVLSTYDVVFYMDVDSRIILERFRGSEGCKNNPHITLDDVECWKTFEKKAIEKLCGDLRIPLVYLKDPSGASEDMVGSILTHMGLE